MNIKRLHLSDQNLILGFAKQLNPNVTESDLINTIIEMFEYDNYVCFGLENDQETIGICSGWITSRFYSGKQLEPDNFIIREDLQSKGYGKVFLQKIEDWAKSQGCKTVELNSYLANTNSHRFYHREGYKTLGFHFQKALSDDK